MAVGSTKVIQVTNIAPQATKDQMQTLFGYLGKIEDIRLYPTIRDVSCPVASRICYIKFVDTSTISIAQHMTNTVFIDRALIVIPVQNGEIPDEYYALEMTRNGAIVPGLHVNEPKLPAHVINSIQGVGSEQVIITTDSQLDTNNLPPYPPLPVNYDSNKIEEIRRTVIVLNMDPSMSSQEVMNYFSTAGEIKYLRTATRTSDNSLLYLIEFSDQPSVLNALKMSGTELNGNILDVQHSTQSIVKPQAKSNEAAQKEIEEAMSRFKEAQNMISASIEPVIGLLTKDKRSSRRSRSRSRGRRRRSRSRSSRRRSRSRRRRSSSRSRRSRSRDRKRRSRSRKRSSSRSRRTRSKSGSRSRTSKSRRSRSKSASWRKKSRERDSTSRAKSKDRDKRSRDRSRERKRSRDRKSKDKEAEKSKARDRSRDKSKEKERPKSKEKEKSKDREGEKSSRDRDKSKERERSKDRDSKPPEVKEKKVDKESSVDKSVEKKRSRDRSRSRSKYRSRSRDRDRKKRDRRRSRSRGSRRRSPSPRRRKRSRTRSRDRKRDKYDKKDSRKDREKERDRGRDRPKERSRSRSKVPRNYDEEEKGFEGIDKDKYAIESETANEKESSEKSDNMDISNSP